MKVLVCGGTGFIGSAIVKALVAQKKHDVYVLTRNKNHALEVLGFVSNQIKIREGDVTRLPTLRNKFEDIDAVIHCVQFPGHPIENPSRGWTYEKYDAEGTENVCHEIKNSSAARIIYISGAGTDDKKGEPWFKAKSRAEKAIKKLGVEYIIVRPSWVYGPHDHSLNKFIAFAKHLPFMPVLGNGLNRVTPLFVDDLALLCVAGLEDPPQAKLTFNAGGPEILTMNELQLKVLKILGKKKPLLHQPLWMLKPLAHVAELLPRPPLTPQALDFVMMDAPIANESKKFFPKIKIRSLQEVLPTYILK